MNQLRFTLKALALVIFAVSCASLAQAQATRTWVSGVGDDVNPCSRTAPCKTYAGAISKTAKDGEISTLDPGGFGTVTITKSITINGGGGGQGYGSILAALAPQGVLVNITDAADVRKTVRLDGLNINGASTGTNGIRMIAGNALFVENVLVDGFTTNGIIVDTTGNPQLHVRNTTIRNCGASGIDTNASGANSTSIDYTGVSITKCATGINARNGTRGSVRDSNIGLNSGTGVNLTGSATEVNIDGSLITGSSTGINVVANTRARIARCLISQNANALGLGGGFVDTGGNNTIMGNSTNQDPNGTLFNGK
ncbi:MAG: hypothetical protein QOD75_1827 [Blastocatellia bacterium]|jgi:hypothetical protein|nr:hypothetical protein [Blastocatellia bacterium]